MQFETWWGVGQRRGGVGNEKGKNDELAFGHVTCEMPFRHLMELSNLQVVIKALSLGKKKKDGLGLELGVF